MNRLVLLWIGLLLFRNRAFPMGYPPTGARKSYCLTRMAHEVELGQVGEIAVTGRIPKCSLLAISPT